MCFCIFTNLTEGEDLMLNRVTVIGRLARDPELRHTQGGTAVVSFSIAVDRDFKDKNTGERTTDWINVVAWRATAEFVSRYFTKGRMVVVDGRLQTRDWTDKDGNKRTAVEVVAESVYFGGSKRDNGDSSGGSNYSAGGYPAAGYSDAPQPQPVDAEFAVLSDDDGELPF